MEPEQKKKLQDYYEKNKEWLEEIALCGDPVVRSMALVILNEGSRMQNDEEKKGQ